MTINVGLFISYVVTILLMLGVPIALALFVVNKFKVSWWVILTGVVTYLISQVIHYPVLKMITAMFQNGSLPAPSQAWLPLFNAVLLGFMAALFEESARYFGFLVVRKKTRKLPSAVGLGIGHGGIESIGYAVWPFFPLFGGVLINFLYILFYNPGAQIASGVSNEQVQYIVAQIAQFWTNPWHLGFLPGIERVIAITTQILLSVLVWKAIRTRSFGWFGLAFFYHMLVDGIAVFLNYNGWSLWAIQGIMAVFMLANIYLIYYFWKEEKDKAAEKLAAASESESSDEEDDGDEYDEDEDEDDDEYDEDDDDYDEEVEEDEAGEDEEDDIENEILDDSEDKETK